MADQGSTLHFLKNSFYISINFDWNQIFKKRKKEKLWNESPSEFSVSKMASEQNRKRFFFGNFDPPLLSVQKKTKNDEKMTKNMRPRGHRSHREERR